MTRIASSNYPALCRYRAHGRIGPYKALPAHCEIVLEKATDAVAKAKDDDKPKKLTPTAAAKRRLKITAGGGTD